MLRKGTALDRCAGLVLTALLSACGTDSDEHGPKPGDGGPADSGAVAWMDSGARDGADHTAVPLWPAAEWSIEPPEARGMDATALELARDYAFQEGKNTQGVVVVRGGAIVAEWYADGADESSYGASWSVAKSFTSALVGIAIDEGSIESVDVSMTEFFPDWAGTVKAAITLRDVLQMASGLEWNEEYDPNSTASSDVIQLTLASEGELQYAASQPLADDPGTVFNYSSGSTMLLSRVLEIATGMSAGDYAREKLFEPLGIAAADWWRSLAGETLTFCCLDMPSRDFARFGLLFARGGRWESRQVISERWVTESVAPSPAFEGYGYQWWLIGRTTDLPEEVFAAQGVDRQHIYVVPHLDLVVVRNGRYIKYDGEPVADPNLVSRYPPFGLRADLGTFPPDTWDNEAFLGMILDAVREDAPNP